MENERKKQKKYENNIVSVIMPAYNSEQYIEEAVNSVLKQTYDQIELIIVDDCSSDGTCRIIKKLAEVHKNIKYCLQKKNSGAGIARKTGVEVAKGRYIAFLDSDDIWVPNKIERQICLLKEKKGDFSYTAMDTIDKTGKSLNRLIQVKESIDYKMLQRNTMIATSTVLLDRNGTGPLEMPEKRYCEDYPVWLGLLRSGRIAYGIKEPMVHYRELKNSLSSNHFRSIKNVWLTQVKDEKINKLRVMVNMIFYAWNAFKKHYL